MKNEKRLKPFLREWCVSDAMIPRMKNLNEQTPIPQIRSKQELDQIYNDYMEEIRNRNNQREYHYQQNQR